MFYGRLAPAAPAASASERPRAGAALRMRTDYSSLLASPPNPAREGGPLHEGFLAPKRRFKRVRRSLQNRCALHSFGPLALAVVLSVAQGSAQLSAGLGGEKRRIRPGDSGLEGLSSVPPPERSAAVRRSPPQKRRRDPEMLELDFSMPRTGPAGADVFVSARIVVAAASAASRAPPAPREVCADVTLAHEDRNTAGPARRVRRDGRRGLADLPGDAPEPHAVADPVSHVPAGATPSGGALPTRNAGGEAKAGGARGAQDALLDACGGQRAGQAALGAHHT
eukprot:scaffold1659_cov255-Pinguiococcus_pyrenoidosus.AAC.59